MLEETGIVADSLKLIDNVVNQYEHTIYKIYLCVSNVNKEAIVLQKGETINFKWVSGEELMNFIDSNCSVDQ